MKFIIYFQWDASCIPEKTEIEAKNHLQAAMTFYGAGKEIKLGVRTGKVLSRGGKDPETEFQIVRVTGDEGEDGIFQLQQFDEYKYNAAIKRHCLIEKVKD